MSARFDPSRIITEARPDRSRDPFPGARALVGRGNMEAHAVSDFEVNPIGTADELMRIRADPSAQQIARLTCALTLNLETIRELSEKRHAARTTNERQLFVAARALRENFGLAPAQARRYAKAALEAAASVNSREEAR